MSNSSEPRPDQVRRESLLPCPFCGGHSFAKRYYNGETTLFAVECQSCTTTIRGFDQSMADAIVAWNTRSPGVDDCGAVLKAAREEIVLAIAFLGRDAGSDRLPATIDGLIRRLAAADKAILAALSQPNPGDGGGIVATTTEFKNELGNTIRITIEGPTSKSTNDLTPIETAKLNETLTSHFATRPTADGGGGEPVAWAVFTPDGDIRFWSRHKEVAITYADNRRGWKAVPLYATPTTLSREALGHEWRPIETAPKDGTKIDLLFAYPRGRQIDCQWRQGDVYGEGGWCWSIPQWGSRPWLGIDWHLLPENEWKTGCYPNMEPTHWMMPPPPPNDVPSPSDGGAS